MITVLEWLFWLSIAGTVYAYAGYPLVLALLARWVSRPVAPPAGVSGELPRVSMIIPVHNERASIEAKLANTRQLEYPDGCLDVWFVDDGSTDGTADVIRNAGDTRVNLIQLGARRGKAAALNAGLARATNDIVVFSDASIRLTPDALKCLVRPFQLPEIGCVSGEDRIQEAGGEGLYGRYELGMRRLESRLHSIVGASGSFYGQRRHLCQPFVPALAPDFLSVLRTVERGYRAIAAADAVGYMRAVEDERDEFERKVRTLLRGMTTLREYVHLLNPVKYGWFAFALGSHKVARWLVPFFLLTALVASAALALQSPWYLAIFGAQLIFYALGAGLLGFYQPLASSIPVKLSRYFTTVSWATVAAWAKYLGGTRQELWSPSRR